MKANVYAIKSMSAHGDYEDLLKFISCQDPALVERIFLVHGEYEVQQVFKSKLENSGFLNVTIPAQHQMEEL